MEPEKEKTGRLPRKGRKRRRVPSKLIRTPEARISRSDPVDRQPEPKRARLASILIAENCEVTHEQLCELLKYAVLGKPDIEKPRWCQLLYQSQLKRIVVVILQGMSQLHFYRFYLEFGFLRKAFKHKFRLPPPSSNFLADIIGLQNKETAGYLPKTIEGSLPSAITKPNINLQNDPIIQKYGSKKVGLLRCLLTEEEMKTFNFPLQGSPDCENFITTKCNGSVTDNSPLFGLDCEMCITSKGRELTRISLVAEGGSCLMDELVKPDDKIIDYITCYSGITKKMLNPVKTKLKDVQRQLKALLPPDAVLVGHSLDLDLRALKIAELNLEELWRDQEIRNIREKFHVLKCLDSVDQKLLFLSRETDNIELPSKNCETIKCLSNKEVFEQARRQVDFHPFSIVQFSFEPFSPLLTEEMNKRMRIKWTEMSTIYAGPFSKDCNLRALKRLFKSFGPVRTMTLVLETHQVRK
uniref:Exonuclease domain-containing protein n=1 Tax=Spermophilus dauricus TaxID=99837 RepID=A0A8C9QS32_SPEDA